MSSASYCLAHSFHLCSRGDVACMTTAPESRKPLHGSLTSTLLSQRAQQSEVSLLLAWLRTWTPLSSNNIYLSALTWSAVGRQCSSRSKRIWNKKVVLPIIQSVRKIKISNTPHKPMLGWPVTIKCKRRRAILVFMTFTRSVYSSLIAMLASRFVSTFSVFTFADKLPVKRWTLLIHWYV